MSLAAADRLTEEGNGFFQQGDFATAADRYQHATALFPSHHLAWKGLGHALLCLARPTDAARAFDRAIGLKADSATALWGGALAHADLGHKPIAQNYLRRCLALQPTWTELARSVPALAQFLQVSTYAAELLRVALGVPSVRTFRHAAEPARTIDVARYADAPEAGLVTYGSLGLANVEWPARRHDHLRRAHQRGRVPLLERRRRRSRHAPRGDRRRRLHPRRRRLTRYSTRAIGALMIAAGVAIGAAAIALARSVTLANDAAS